MHIKRYVAVGSTLAVLAISATTSALAATSQSQRPVKFSSAVLNNNYPMRQASSEVNRSEWRPELMTPVRRPAATFSSPASSPAVTPAAVSTVAKVNPPAPQPTTTQHPAPVQQPVKAAAVVTAAPPNDCYGKAEAPGGTPQAIAQRMLVCFGWGMDQWDSLDKLWSHESGWAATKSNYQGSGAYGIPQALPGRKMASAGADWRTNPVTQIIWGLGYIKDRYGSPAAAWYYWLRHNSY